MDQSGRHRPVLGWAGQERAGSSPLGSFAFAPTGSESGIISCRSEARDQLLYTDKEVSFVIMCSCPSWIVLSMRCEYVNVFCLMRCAKSKQETKQNANTHFENGPSGHRIRPPSGVHRWEEKAGKRMYDFGRARGKALWRSSTAGRQKYEFAMSPPIYGHLLRPCNSRLLWKTLPTIPPG